MHTQPCYSTSASAIAIMARRRLLTYSRKTSLPISISPRHTSRSIRHANVLHVSKRNKCTACQHKKQMYCMSAYETKVQHVRIRNKSTAFAQKYTAFAHGMHHTASAYFPMHTYCTSAKISSAWHKHAWRITCPHTQAIPLHMYISALGKIID